MTLNGAKTLDRLKSWREDGTQGWFHMNISYYMNGENVHMNMLDWYEHFFIIYKRSECSYEHSICSWLFMKIFKAHITWTCLLLMWTYLLLMWTKIMIRTMWTYATKSLCSYEHFCFRRKSVRLSAILDRNFQKNFSEIFWGFSRQRDFHREILIQDFKLKILRDVFFRRYGRRFP